MTRRSIKGVLAKEDLQKLLAKEKRCHICGRRFTKKNPATIDHVTPLVLGGTNDLGNLALAHGSCNSEKGGRRTRLL
jgi:5-methylcytosine-specific restriction endonuclease McrA